MSKAFTKETDGEDEGEELAQAADEAQPAVARRSRQVF